MKKISAIVIASLFFLTVPSANAQTQIPPVQSAIVLNGIKNLPLLSEKDGRRFQSVALSMLNKGESTRVTFKIQNQADQTYNLTAGISQVEINAPAVLTDSTLHFTVWQNGMEKLSGEIILKPIRPMTVYILPHSHNDLGYTEIQTNVEKKQINNLLTGIAYAQQTKNYPPGARFIWNLEGTYAADLFLQRMNEEQKSSFIAAVKDGGVALNGMYLNTLTGLCRPEELIQLFRFSNELAALCDTTVQSAMISDVPGYTWGTVSAMAQAGIRYFSAAPNNFDRIGDILEKWEDKPFWWIGPSGKEKVLVWIPYRGYALSHGLPDGLTKDFVISYMHILEEKKFPYDISYIRWSGHGDNAVPDISISEFVKTWSEKYISPRFIISSTTTAFRAFDEKYGRELPVQKGDWTGYWEDGSGSSALETSENRTSSSRVSQAEALWSMISPHTFPIDSFRLAWKHVLLYSEHTWGADESVTRPLSQKTMEQWIVKKSYATIADSISEALLQSAIDAQHGDRIENAFDVFNTSSWARQQLVTLPAEQTKAGDIVRDQDGKTIPSQRLSTGALAFLANGVPAYSSRRFFISPGPTPGAASINADQHGADNGIIHFTINDRTGAITSLRNKSIDNEFVDTASGEGLNDYLFLPGSELSDIRRINKVNVSVKEKGPLLATLVIRSAAPGCQELVRELTVVRGMDFIEIANFLDKNPAELDPYPGDYGWANIKGKESLNIAFPFHVAGGEMKLDIPMAMMRPETDQIPGSCKNWLEVGGWADVSNKNIGVTWVTLDAPLIEVGGITARLLGSQTNPSVWRKHIEPTQRLYSWALNNHWETNYRAYQEGKIIFRYAIQPHGSFDAMQSTRLATGLAHPFIVRPAIGKGLTSSLLLLNSPDIIVLALKPSSDHKARMVTLYNPGEKRATTTLTWSEPVQETFLSNTSEKSLQKLSGTISVNPLEVVTLRVENK